MTAEIGRVLGGRYRLVAPIGLGASAQVYLADDVRLRRRVALKMLHDALAGDAEFLRRFRAEARAAAALSHPNVMAVYDWGDDEVAFIVTEYLGGGSLRALLDRGQLLSPSQALTVGLEATRALDYAHRRGFVHRDIKPANLLFGEEQRLRIADFGLARALAEAAWTEPQGAMLGTARYASPEQAKGEKLDGKADVYSLALVIIEAVTGTVPFGADTTIGTLMARVGKQLEVPDALGPLQEILIRAGHPDPDERIDARELATGLLRAAKALPKPAPLPLAGALPAAGEVLVDLDPTVHAPVAEAARADLTADDLDLAPPDWVNQSEPDFEARQDLANDPEADSEVVVPPEPGSALHDPAWSDAPTPVPEPVDRVVDPTAHVLVPPVSLGAAVGPTGGTSGGPPTDPGSAGPDPRIGGPDDVDGRRRRWPWAVLVLLALVGVGGAVWAVAAGRGPASSQRVVVLPVPVLTGRTQDTAEAVAASAGWKTTVVRARRDGTVKGEVISTDPSAGIRLKLGRSIELTVSEGQTEVAVPVASIEGKTAVAAASLLNEVGLKMATARSRFDEVVAEGSVIGAVGATPAKLEKGSTVLVVLSKGPEPRTVPSGLVGSTEAEATAAITDLGLRVAVNRQYNDKVPEGQVVAQIPPVGSKLPRGGTVTIEVSRGPETVAVPDVTGASTPAGAAAILRAAGLRPGSVSGPAEGTPTGTSPGRGTTVKKGSTVNILMG